MEIEIKTIIDRIEELYECGLQDDGSHTRMAFSQADQKGRDKFIGYFKELGIEPGVDEAGNIIARMEGEDSSLPAIAIGSHLDTVPDGGKYDGVLGCMAGLAICETFIKNGVKPRHSIEVIVFTDEEGFRFGSGLFGSSAICGKDLGISESDPDIYGETRKAVMKPYGISLEKIYKAKRKADSLHCFLELHIEQGARLYKSQMPIGVVTSIAGVSRVEVQVAGEANHSGSTAMPDRRDALAATADFIGKLPELVNQYGNEFTVATVGSIRVEPNSVNVIPGSCTFSLEIRDQDEQLIRLLEERSKSSIEKACGRNGCTCRFKKLSYHRPGPMTDWVAGGIERAVKRRGIPYLKMPSGAFHDSIVMAEVFPTGMIFVPSINGISHSRHEFTEAEDIKRGLNVLLEAVKEMDHINLL